METVHHLERVQAVLKIWLLLRKNCSCYINTNDRFNNTAAQTVSIDTFGLTGQLLFRVVPALLVLHASKAAVHSFKDIEWINTKLLQHCWICTNFMRKRQIGHNQVEVLESWERKHFGRYCKYPTALVSVPSPTKRRLILWFTEGADEVKSCETKPSVLFIDNFNKKKQKKNKTYSELMEPSSLTEQK